MPECLPSDWSPNNEVNEGELGAEDGSYVNLYDEERAGKWAVAALPSLPSLTFVQLLPSASSLRISSAFTFKNQVVLSNGHQCGAIDSHIEIE